MCRQFPRAEGRLLLKSQTGARITYREDIPISLSRDRWKWSLGQFHMAELQTQDYLLLREQASKVWARGGGRGHDLAHFTSLGTYYVPGLSEGHDQVNMYCSPGDYRLATLLDYETELKFREVCARHCPPLPPKASPHPHPSLLAILPGPGARPSPTASEIPHVEG